MALKECRECGQQISTEAKACPHCGVSNPASKSGIRLGCLGAIAVVVVLIVLGRTSETPVPPQQIACREDYKKCADNADMINNYSKMSNATFACKQELNKSVKYGTPEWTWSEFGTFYKGADYVKTGIVKIVDKDVKIQNAFGAKVNSTVECWYDFNNKSALIVRAEAR